MHSPSPYYNGIIITVDTVESGNDASQESTAKGNA